jgi:hypothetical protein
MNDLMNAMLPMVIISSIEMIPSAIGMPTITAKIIKMMLMGGFL